MNNKLLKAVDRGDVFDVAVHLCDVDQALYDTDGVSVLQRAAWSGRVDVCLVLLDADRCKPLLNVASHGETPLMAACRLGHLEAVEALLGNGATFQSLDIFGGTLVEAARRNCPLLLRTLKSKGVRDGDTVLHAAIERSDNVQFVDVCCDLVNRRDSDGRTPLMYAAIYNRVKIASRLIQRQARVNAVDVHGNNAAHYAAGWNHAKALQVLLDGGADSTSANNVGDSVITLMSKHANLEVHAQLLDVRDCFGTTALMYAAKKDCRYMVEFLLALGASKVGAVAEEGTHSEYLLKF